MKKYFYSDGKEKEGPFSFEELKDKDINPNTLIWYQGLEDWTSAKYISELEEILQLSPPPVPANEIKMDHPENEIDKKNKKSAKNKKETKSTKHKKQSMFLRPLSFEGRIRRAEYAISFIISAFLIAFLDLFIQEEVFSFLVLAYIPIYWFLFAQGAKRCHDMGNNGWWQLIPFYPLWMIFAKGEEGLSNEYGLNPKNTY